MPSLSQCFMNSTPFYQSKMITLVNVSQGKEIRLFIMSQSGRCGNQDSTLVCVAYSAYTGNLSSCHWFLWKLLKSIFYVTDGFQLSGSFQLTYFGTWGFIGFPCDSSLVPYHPQPSSSSRYIVPSSNDILEWEHLPKIGGFALSILPSLQD